MTKFGILMVLTASPMPAEKQAEALREIRHGFESAARDLGCQVECRVITMPESCGLKDLKSALLASMASET